MGRTGDVQEGDIYKIDNNRLYYFSTYRGMTVYDLNDPANPKQLSRLPILGYPIEMYVQGTTVFALIRDAMVVSKSDPMRFESRHTSQLLTIDVADPSAPKLLKSIDIQGELREGVSRKIDDTIYVVSYFSQSYWGYYYRGANTRPKEQAWVYSFNVKNVLNPTLVDKLQIFDGGSFYNVKPGEQGSISRNFSSVALSATANTLHVVENWNSYGWSRNGGNGCGSSSFSKQEAVVSIIDISNPSGAIRRHSRFTTDGQLTDQFKHTYSYDAATGRATYFGIFAEDEWQSQGCNWQRNVKNSFESWDVSNGNAPVRVASLSIGKPNETVRGTSFDLERKVAYAITAERIDPLYVIGFSDVTKPTVLSSIDGLSGDMSVFRLIANKQFLIGIGRDTSDACTGFDANSQRWRSNVAVSIIDVQNLNAIRLVQRGCVDIQNAEWVGSDISWNLDQAHKLIGMASDARANVISVPVYSWGRSTNNFGWWNSYQTSVGLMSWDLTKYDATKNERQQTVLANHGTINHPHGQVRRSIVFTHKGATERRMMLNLSDTHMSLVDIDNLSAPVRKADVEVAPYSQEIFRFGSHLVEHVKPDGYGYGIGLPSEFRVKAANAGVGDSPTLTTFSAGSVERALKWKENLLVFRSVSQTGRDFSGVVELLVFDLSNPLAPRLASTTNLGVPFNPYRWGWCGVGLGFWGGYWFDALSTFAATDAGFALLSTSNGPAPRFSSVKSLIFVDLANVNAPALKNYVLGEEVSNGKRAPKFWGGLVADGVDGKALYVTSQVEVSSAASDNNSQELVGYRHFAERWEYEAGELVARESMNVPGVLTRVFQSGNERRMMTRDDQYEARRQTSGQSTYTYYVQKPRIHLLRQQGSSNRAELMDTLGFGYNRLVSLNAQGDDVYVNTGRSYSYGYGGDVPVSSDGSSGSGGGDAAPQDVSDVLNILSTANGKFVMQSSSQLKVSNTEIMGTRGNHLMLRLSGEGLLLIDVTDKKAPFGRAFFRTLGWNTHVDWTEDAVYTAAGYFGLQYFPLDGTNL